MANKEELEAMGISNYSKNEGTRSASNNSNGIASAVKIIGVIEIICGFILGIVLGNTYKIGYYSANFNTGLCVGIIITGIIIGIFILGFGEVIQLLQDIKSNTMNSKNISNNDIPKL